MQYSEKGSLQHLLSIESLKTDTIEQIFSLAEKMNSGFEFAHLKNTNVCNAFFENSTRTLCSFELAEKKLGCHVVNFNTATSALKKGESLADTILTLNAMGFDAFVIRHSTEGSASKIAELVGPGACVVNAGDGKNEHPTQALLDAYTIAQHKSSFNNLSVGIFGDLLHSRVAGSLIHILHHLGVRDLRLVGPKSLLPTQLTHDYINTENDMNKGLEDLDVIVMLRMQRERMTDDIAPSIEEYFLHYGLSEERLNLAKPDAIVMHPGPMNREIEIASSVADGNQSVILDQVHNGVLIRMAVMAKLLGDL